jgi:hypothetical protein
MGSHYDVSPLTLVRNPLTGQLYSFEAGSFAQLESLVFVPQLAIWPIYTVLAGLVGAGLLAVTLAARRPTLPTAPAAAT